MNVEDLSEILKDMYENAPKKEQVVHIHLFGIKYAEIIKKNNFRIAELIEKAGMKKSYKIEISKGIKLSKFVKSIL